MEPIFHKPLVPSPLLFWRQKKPKARPDMSISRQQTFEVLETSGVFKVSSPIVIKVGGSLFDLPELGEKLVQMLSLPGMKKVLLVPGGGATANVVREWDRRHQLGEEVSHWLALQALSLNARFLANLLPASQREIVGDLERRTESWRQGRWLIADPYVVARADDGRQGCLRHCWSVTSDSLAARIAVLVKARHLILLKSTDPPLQRETANRDGEKGKERVAGSPIRPFTVSQRAIDWGEAGRRGYVDAFFGEAIRQAARPGEQPMKVRAINFRQWPASAPTDSPVAGL
jgi:aspartokinase-like uncharacterized kinase